jgi:hypothetical protein
MHLEKSTNDSSYIYIYSLRNLTIFFNFQMSQILIKLLTDSKRKNENYEEMHVFAKRLS